MKRVYTSKAPAALGPYSQGVISGGMVYTSGQVAVTPAGEVVTGSIESETRQIMANLGAILEAAGSDFSRVIQARIAIAHPELFSEVNKIYAGYFQRGAEPTRECVVAAPPLEGLRVEISVIAEVQASPAVQFVKSSEFCGW